MRFDRLRAVMLPFIALVMVVVFATSANGAPPAVVATSPAPASGSVAMTVYAITNPNQTPLNVQQVFADSSGFNYTFSSTIPSGGTTTYHVRDIPQIPSPFQGTLTIYASQTFTAQIVGYDYPPGGSHQVWLPIVTSGS
ncbi:MAG TPA: hypothetical protein VFZ25_02200 [Chloroflexota bacterium]|nr:hypothetical protein [Chloroflexota bacterium]